MRTGHFPATEVFVSGPWNLAGLCGCWRRVPTHLPPSCQTQTVMAVPLGEARFL